jgi:hypothetical protein
MTTNSLQGHALQLWRLVIHSKDGGEDLCANCSSKESSTEAKHTRFGTQWPRRANARRWAEPLNAHHNCCGKNCKYAPNYKRPIHADGRRLPYLAYGSSGHRRITDERRKRSSTDGPRSQAHRRAQAP